MNMMKIMKLENYETRKLLAIMIMLINNKGKIKKKEDVYAETNQFESAIMSS